MSYTTFAGRHYVSGFIHLRDYMGTYDNLKLMMVLFDKGLLDKCHEDEYIHVLRGVYEPTSTR